MLNCCYNIILNKLYKHKYQHDCCKRTCPADPGAAGGAMNKLSGCWNTVLISGLWLGDMMCCRSVGLIRVMAAGLLVSLQPLSLFTLLEKPAQTSTRTQHKLVTSKTSICCVLVLVCVMWMNGWNHFVTSSIIDLNWAVDEEVLPEPTTQEHPDLTGCTALVLISVRWSWFTSSLRE